MLWQFEFLIAMGVMTAKNALAGLDGKLNPELVVNRTVPTIKTHECEAYESEIWSSWSGSHR
jgi:hypothetical protein